MYNPSNPNAGMFQVPQFGSSPLGQWGRNRSLQVPSTPYPQPGGGPTQVPGQPQGPSSAPRTPMQRPQMPSIQGTTPQAPQPLLGNVTSSITPMSVFTPQMTNYAANQAQAEYERAASPNFLMKQYDRPGVSRSAGTASAALPMMAALRGQGASEAANIRASDEMANRQSLLAGQKAQDQEGLSLMSLLSMIQGQGRNNEMNDFGATLQLLQGLL
jgi:hypothetical protein